MELARPYFAGLILSVLVVAGASGPSFGQTPRHFEQKEFCISFWVDPPADAQMEEHYRRLAEANFNVVLGGFGARTAEQIARQLAICERLGLKAIVPGRDGAVDQLPDGPACLGYLLRDEPKAAQFAELGQRVAEIREKRPGKLAYINLFPSHATPKHFGVPTYDEYVQLFLQQTRVDVLCFDRYPVMLPNVDERDGYCENLDVIRRHAMQAGIPFWNFFNTMPFGRHLDPTEAQLRWQIYTSIAYGAKGVLYFCYWTPTGREFPKGGAIITADGQPTRHYDQARRINAHLKNLGPTLMQLTSTRIVRIKPSEKAAAALQGGALRNLTDGDYLVGFFDHADRRQAILLNNYSFAYTLWPTVEFAVAPDKVVEVDPETGREIPVRDDSPEMEGLQISLDAGEGRLFLLDVK